MKENSFKLAKEKKQKISRKNNYEHGYSDDIALLANTPAQAQALLHSLERAAASIGLYVNADKTEYMYFD